MDDLKRGELFQSRYLIEGLLGRGGMGVVYSAFDTQQEHRACAIKVLLRHHLEKLHYRKRLAAEIEMMSRLQHPNIVRIYDVYQGLLSEEVNSIEQIPYIVMEKLEGQGLDELIKEKQTLTLEQAIRLIQQALSALDYAHQKGIIHRDLKPENLFLARQTSGDVQLKLLDFGVAKDLESNVSLTASLEFPMIGTPHYMAPEQVRNEKTTVRSDLYSMGIILYQLITGFPPFAMSSLECPSELNILPASLRLTWLHVNSPPPDLNFEPSFDQIIKSTLAKSPQERPQSAQELSQMLSLWLEEHADFGAYTLPSDRAHTQVNLERIEQASLLTLEALEEATRFPTLSQSIDRHILDLQPEKAFTTRLDSSLEPPKEKAHLSLKFNSNPLFKKSKSTLFLYGFFICLIGFMIIFLFKDISETDDSAPVSLTSNQVQKKTTQEQTLVETLSQERAHLSIQLPQGLTNEQIHEVIDALKEKDLQHPLTAIQRLNLAYLSTWLSKPDMAKQALIELSKIDQGQFTNHQHWHIYGLTLLRVRLKTSIQSRFKLALKAFKVADRLFNSLNMKDFNQIDQVDKSYIEIRLAIYLQQRKWKSMIELLESLQSKKALPMPQLNLLKQAYSQLEQRDLESQLNAQ